jgi:hypothetical protein
MSLPVDNIPSSTDRADRVVSITPRYGHLVRWPVYCSISPFLYLDLHPHACSVSRCDPQLFRVSVAQQARRICVDNAFHPSIHHQCWQCGGDSLLAGMHQPYRRMLAALPRCKACNCRTVLSLTACLCTCAGQLLHRLQVPVCRTLRQHTITFHF